VAGRWKGTAQVVHYTGKQAAKRGGVARLAKQQAESTAPKR
jgi:hypothetical protein